VRYWLCSWSFASEFPDVPPSPSLAGQQTN
jgi:hypothetical protein